MPGRATALIVPVLPRSVAELRALSERFAPYRGLFQEIIIVDDGARLQMSDDDLDLSGCTLVQHLRNMGPAAARNTGAAAARSEMLFFTDADCRLGEGFAEALEDSFGHAISVGDTFTPTVGLFSDAVARLGYPGGGNQGFHNVWPVDSAGRTISFSSCNLLIDREVFQQLGGFPEGFPYPSGEDTALAQMARAAGHDIHYCRLRRIVHEERGTFGAFLRWHVKRGRGLYHLKRYLAGRRLESHYGDLYKARMRFLMTNMVRQGVMAPLLVFLTALMLACQRIGYGMESRRHRHKGSG